MKCLMKYQWVKLPRNHLPEGKGIMNAWAKLASRAAFRKGQASYCGHINAVSPGMWSGGVVGLKSILGSRSRVKSLEALSKLSELGYISYSLNAKTKKLTYQITDWVIKCSGEECMDGTVYATEGYGFLCLPRNITDRLVEQQYIFDEADAWLDLWCHTVSEDPDNAFSFLAPIAQFGKFGTVLTLETLGQRWNWEKTKVWRFFQKHGDVFTLHRLPGAFGCLIFNKLYPTDAEVSIPESEKIERIIAEIRILAKNEQKVGSDQENLSRLVAIYSRQLLTECAEENENTMAQNRVALFDPYILRAYFSHSNCKKCKDDTYHHFAIVNDGEMVEVENEAGVGFINNHMVGNLKIVKTSSDGRVEGFSFRVTGENYDEVFKTDANGEIFIEGLRIGKYTVTEVEDEVSSGYKRPEPVEVELVADETLTVNVHNDKITIEEPPKTGDNSNMGLWFGLLGLSCLGMVGTVIYGRRRKREELEG